MKKLAILAVIGGSVALAGCTPIKTQRAAAGALIGGATGAAVGAVATGTIPGAVVGAGIGAGVGALVGIISAPPYSVNY